MFTFVEAGSTNGDKGFVCTSNKGSAVVGTNNLAFSQFSSSGEISAGDGLSKSGNTLSVDLQTNGGLGIASGELFVSLDASGIDGVLGVSDGGTGATSASAARTALGLVIGTDVEAKSAKLTELATMAQNTANKLADLTSTEVGILDGATVTTSELNKLDGVTATTSELNILDGVTATASEINILDGVTATATEINLLDGVTATTTEINYIDGVTSAIQTQLDNKQTLSAKLTELATMAQATANSLADLTSTEVQILDGATVTTTELNKLDGLTASTTELNYVDGVTSAIQTQLGNKQPLDSELTELATMGSTTASALADLTQAEVQILDGATVTTSELNKLDGGTAATSTTLASGDRFICNDAGTMKQVALSDLVTFFEDGATSGFDIDGGSYS